MRRRGACYDCCGKPSIRYRELLEAKEEERESERAMEMLVAVIVSLMAVLGAAGVLAYVVSILRG